MSAPRTSAQQAAGQAGPLPQRPSVLVLSGHDPSGGAGLQADLESIACHGVHSMSVLTMVTVQNCAGVRRYYSQPLSIMQEQLEALLDERPIQAIKIGAIGAPEQVGFAAGLCARHAALPVVWDPVLAPSRGAGFADASCRQLLRERLLPQVRLLTASRPELVRLAEPPDPELADDALCAKRLQQYGCGHILLTSAERTDGVLTHRLFRAPGEGGRGGGEVRSFTSEYRAGDYHGTGCTLSAAIAANLARGLGLTEAIQRSLDFVARSLAQADQIAAGQFVPRRVQ